MTLGEKLEIAEETAAEVGRLVRRIRDAERNGHASILDYVSSTIDEDILDVLISAGLAAELLNHHANGKREIFIHW